MDKVFLDTLGIHYLGKQGTVFLDMVWQGIMDMASKGKGLQGIFFKGIKDTWGILHTAHTAHTAHTPYTQSL